MTQHRSTGAEGGVLCSTQSFRDQGSFHIVALPLMSPESSVSTQQMRKESEKDHREVVGEGRRLRIRDHFYVHSFDKNLVIQPHLDARKLRNVVY